MELAPKSLTFEMVEIGGLPLYNQDYDDGSGNAAFRVYRVPEAGEVC